jgi:ABC-type dipeptide/oligopeptide/nickel transport system permease component
MLGINATEENVARVREDLGLDQSLAGQLGHFLAGSVTLDFGDSIVKRAPVRDVVGSRILPSVYLILASVFVAIVLAIPLGILSAARRNRLADHTVRLLTMVTFAMPTFWLGLMLILLFGVMLRFLPAGGRGGIEHLILPAFTLGYFTSAAILRLTRSAMLEVLGSDYIKFARLKGLHEQVVLWKHGLKNALLPVVTFAVMLFVQFLGGAVVTETVFAWPGLGRLILESITTRDYPIVQAGVLVLSALYLAGNLFVDVLYSYLNPRIRHARA